VRARRCSLSSYDAQKIKTALRCICRNAIESHILHLPTPRNGAAHIVGQDDELRRPAVVVAAKTYDVDLSHSDSQRSRQFGRQAVLEGEDSPAELKAAGTSIKTKKILASPTGFEPKSRKSAGKGKE
jgi:hypothetical protein